MTFSEWLTPHVVILSMKPRVRYPALVRALLFGLLALACSPTPVRALDAPKGPRPLNVYQQFVSDKLTEFEKKYPIPSAACPSDQIHLQALMAGSEVRVWTWTGNDALLKNSHARLTSILASPKAGRDFFFGIYPLTYCVETLSGSGRMEASMKADIGQFLTKNASPSEGNELHNRTLLRACGFANAAKLWPDSPSAAVWKNYTANVESMLLKLEDVAENAPNYNRLDMACVFLLQDLLGTPSVLQKPGFREMYLRYRDQLAPSGALPSYGDSGRMNEDENDPFGYDNGMVAAGFERAAVVYHDPTFRWAALKNLQVESRRDQFNKPGELFFIGLAADWANLAMPPEAPVLLSKILTRRDAPGHIAQDKLILRTSPGKTPPSYLELDLFGRGAHAHENQRGAITYLEENERAIVSTLGYNNRQPEHANLFLMAQAQEPFPYFELPANKWLSSQTPTLPLKNPADTRITLRVTGGQNGVTLWVSNVGIQSDSGLKPLETFLDLRNWKGPVAPELVQEDGRHALRWKFPPGITFVDFKDPGSAFNQAKQVRLAFQWKLSNADETVRPLVLRFPGPYDFNAGLRVLAPVLTDSTVEDRRSAHYGSVTMDHWFTEDTRMQRRMVLFDDGALVVADTVSPGPLAKGMLAGPVWNPACRTVKPLTPGAFLIGPQGHTCRLFLNAEQPMPFGSKTLDVWSQKNHTVVYGQTVASDRPLRTVSVFLPGSDGDKPTVTYRPDSVVITLSPGRVLSLSGSNQWQVSGE